MQAMIATTLRRPSFATLLAILLAFAPAAHGQSLEWGATKYFQYNIENVLVAPTPATVGSYDVTVIFSVINPTTGDAWDIKVAAPFTTTGANLTLDIGWDPGSDFTNTGSENAALSPVATPAPSKGAAAPMQIRGLQGAAVACSGALDCPGITNFTNRYRYTRRAVRPVAFVANATRGRIAIEGRPVCNGVPGYTCPDPVGTATGSSYINIPVRSAVANFTLSPAGTTASAIVADPRRQVVDISKCQLCHDGRQHGDVVVPRLSLHGGNRNENLHLCVVCHNPNQTDVPYRRATSGTTLDPRISGPEVPIDFKTMVHSIHSGGFRTRPLVIVGFGSSVNDFSGVRFPSELRNCTSCHVEVAGRGTYELPLAANVLGTTVRTQSAYLLPLTTTDGSPPRSINVNPADDTRISPTAAVCSSCHDKAEVRDHMIRRGGASFSTTQAEIGRTVVERCANCHGPGKDRDVRKVHQIGGSSDD